jgi:CSLREA domain-containing protein
LEGRTLLSSIVVNTTADSTDPASSSTVSLRDAIDRANLGDSATTITFSPTVFASAKTITLGGPLIMTPNNGQPTTITGPAAGVTISGNNATQGFVIDAQVTVTLSMLTITKCKAGLGAGIQADGKVTIKNCTISGNDATSNDDGGGIAGGGTVTLINDTIANNIGDGLNPRGGTWNIFDCTISGNSSYGSYPAGGIYQQGGSIVNIGNTIVAGNTAVVAGPDVEGAYVSKGHNLIGSITNTTGWVSTDQTGTDTKPLKPLLGALANNGGPTLTMLPATGSPALDKGSNSLIPSGITTDQRGLARINNTTVDVGAVEVGPVIKITAPANQTATMAVSKSITLGSFTQSIGTSPFKDVITWGDGSAITTLSLTAAGTIPATAHTFAKAGTFAVTEIITDAKSNKSNTATFTVTVTAPTGSIAGTVFGDVNADGKIDNGEFGVGLWTVYLDLNKNGALDAGDKSVTTDISGKFSFAGLAAGSYVVRVVPVSGIAATKPTGGVLTITLAAGQNSAGNLFGEKAV